MDLQRSVFTYIALSAAVLFWGLSFVATKVALENIPTFTLVFARFSIASLLFLIVLLKTGFPRFTLQEYGKVLLVAFFEPGLYFVFETYGLQYTTAPKASLIIATIPLAVAVFAGIWLKEGTPLITLAGILLSLVGITILVVFDPEFSRGFKGSLTGDLLIFGAVISGALYMVCARDLGKKRNAMEITALQTFLGAIFFAPGFLYELPRIQWSGIQFASIAAVVYLTVFATVLAFLCYNFALTRLTASRASIFVNCIPVVCAIGAWIILGEKLTPLQMMGGAIVIVAVCLSNMKGFRPAIRLLKRFAV
jgi:drug/metabolite transporter (DMT)-like permease